METASVREASARVIAALSAAGRSRTTVNDLGPGWHDEQAGRDRRIRTHLRQLKALGVDVTVSPAAA